MTDFSKTILSYIYQEQKNLNDYTFINNFSNILIKHIFNKKENSCYSGISLYIILQLLYKCSGNKLKNKLSELILREINISELMNILNKKINIVNIIINVDELSKNAINECNKSNCNIINATLEDIQQKVDDLVYKYTNKEISHIDVQVSQNMLCILLNILTFDKKWKHPFVPVDKKLSFKNIDGTESLIEFMMFDECEKLNYKKVHDCTVFQIPYKKCDNCVFTCIYPKNINNLYELLDKDPHIFTEFHTSFKKKYHMRICMPDNINICSSLKFKPILTKLGVDILFDSRSDLKMSDVNNTFIDYINQDVVLKLDKQGTKAVAVTSCKFVFECETSNSIPVININVTSPFIFTISCDNLILFIGQYITV